jgi:sulfite reductase alpha subunit-like flavoprotein
LEARTARLDGFKFAVFGVGSSQFGPTFLGFAKALENKLKELGATEVNERGEYDAISKADPVEAVPTWIRTLGITLP